MRVMGLPFHLHDDHVFEAYGDFYGGFVKTDQYCRVVNLSSSLMMQVEVIGDGNRILLNVRIIVGRVRYEMLLWA